ncbi:MAG TPA: phage holin family protein [Verrucomicrobiae bacterium]|nr:phage holin family protein [Verrucomicrobiae bacterium]
MSYVRDDHLQMPPKLKTFLFHWANNTVGVVVASYLVHGISWQRPLDLVMAAFFLGVLNAFVRPLLRLLSLPLMILTLGLFNFVINALLLEFVGWLMQPFFNVAGFGPAFWGALIITIVAFFLNRLTRTSTTRVTVRRTAPPPRNPPDDGNGPVIDI